MSSRTEEEMPEDFLCVSLPSGLLNVQPCAAVTAYWSQPAAEAKSEDLF
jgi:hypothetical protein